MDRLFLGYYLEECHFLFPGIEKMTEEEYNLVAKVGEASTEAFRTKEPRTKEPRKKLRENFEEAIA